MISRERLEALLATAPQLRIGLIGDLFLDRYLEIDASIEEVSIETGLAAHQVTGVRNSAGALGTVLQNLAALGVGLLRPISVIGDDGHGDDLMRTLRRTPAADAAGVLRDERRLTPTYTKPLVGVPDAAPRELNRLDVRSRSPLALETAAVLERRLRSMWAEVDGWIVLDQLPEGEEGVVGPRVRDVLAELWEADRDKLVYCDSRANSAALRCGVVKTNHLECFAAVRRPAVDDLGEVLVAVTQRAEAAGLAMHCTIGEQGAATATPGEAAVHTPGFPAEGPVDVVGAGDAATSGYVTASLAGATPTEAACVGNLTASITVQQIGRTGTATPEQVLARWDETLGSRA